MSNTINTVEQLITEIKNCQKPWDNIIKFAWFRGEMFKTTPLKPKVFRSIEKIEAENKKNIYENDIIQEFRMRAPALYPKTPRYERIDEWLFLMRHNELPTRLLDWTEGALFALFFAINSVPFMDKEKMKVDPSPVVWMINPIIFNFITNKRMFLPLSWNDRSNCYHKNSPFHLELKYIGTQKLSVMVKKDELVQYSCNNNIRAAFSSGKLDGEEKYPIALKPQHIHPRVTAQRSCFTVHGWNRDGIQDFFKGKKIRDLITEEHLEACSYHVNQEEYFNGLSIIENILKNFHDVQFNALFLRKFEINPEEKVLRDMLEDLKMLGISYSTLFPELTGLSAELRTIKTYLYF